MRRFQRDFEPGQFTWLPIWLLSGGIGVGSRGPSVVAEVLILIWAALLGVFWQWRSRRPVLDRVKSVVKVHLVLIAIMVLIAIPVVLVGGGSFDVHSSSKGTGMAMPFGLLVGLIATEAYLRRGDDQETRSSRNARRSASKAETSPATAK